tara:strand:- start:435 stop:770 length:336 start_codon:yes stop_codon:yes gene_type:complete
MGEKKNAEGIAPNDLSADLTDWVEYTLTRAKGLDRLSMENENCPKALARFVTKAGCYRSLATEIQRILKAYEKMRDLKAFEAQRDSQRRMKLDALGDKVKAAGLDSADYTV